MSILLVWFGLYIFPTKPIYGDGWAKEYGKAGRLRGVALACEAGSSAGNVNGVSFLTSPQG